MPAEKKIVPYKVAKGNRPKIEEVFGYCLYDELRVAALEFAQFMRDNEMLSRLYTSNTREYVVTYKKEPICNIRIFAEEDWKSSGRGDGGPQSFSVTLRLHRYDTYKDRIAGEKLDSLQWSNVIYDWIQCRKNCLVCCYRGIDRAELNSEFKDVCWRNLTVLFAPGEIHTDGVKRFLLLEKQARDEQT